MLLESDDTGQELVCQCMLLLQGCPARICMPITAAPIKVESVKRLGGIIELVGETYAEAQTYAQVCLLSPFPKLKDMYLHTHSAHM